MMEESFSLIACDPPLLDPVAFRLWLEGRSVEEAAVSRLRAALVEDPSITQFGDSAALDRMFAQETRDQFHVFRILEEFLTHPQLLADQRVITLAEPVQQTIIERYYEFDESVVREFLGKKLGSKLRKELDNISTKARIHIDSCKRQFENMKRVMKHVKDIKDASSTPLDVIERDFCLSRDLASKYAHAIFLSHHRYHTTKKKAYRVSFLSYSDLDSMAGTLMAQWTAGGLGFDPAFLAGVIDLKGVLGGDARLLEGVLRPATVGTLQALGTVAPDRLAKIDKKFGALVKGVLALGADVSRAKAHRNFFVDLADKVGEPCKRLDLSEEDVAAFLAAVARVMGETEALRRLAPAGERLFGAVQKCIARMYRRIVVG